MQDRAVKATLFDKTAEANRNLRWHQDNVIAVDKNLNCLDFMVEYFILNSRVVICRLVLSGVNELAARQ